MQFITSNYCVVLFEEETLQKNANDEKRENKNGKKMENIRREKSELGEMTNIAKGSTYL